MVLLTTINTIRRGGSNVVNVSLLISVVLIPLVKLLSYWYRCTYGCRAHGTTMTQGLSYRFNPAIDAMLRISASWCSRRLVSGIYIFTRGHNYPGGGFIAV